MHAFLEMHCLIDKIDLHIEKTLQELAWIETHQDEAATTGTAHPPQQGGLLLEKFILWDTVQLIIHDC